MKLDSNEKTNQLPKTFYVTYFARTHNGQPIKNGGAIITRKGQWHKPNTNQWRHAVGLITVRSAD